MKQKPKQIKNKTSDTENKTEKKTNSGNSTPKRLGGERPRKTTETSSKKSVKEQVEASEAASKNQNTLIKPGATSEMESSKSSNSMQQKLPEELGPTDSNIDAH